MLPKSKVYEFKGKKKQIRKRKKEENTFLKEISFGRRVKNAISKNKKSGRLGVLPTFKTELVLQSGSAG